MTAGLGFGGETKAPARVKRKQPKPSMMNEEERHKCVCLPHDKACALKQKCFCRVLTILLKFSDPASMSHHHERAGPKYSGYPQ